MKFTEQSHRSHGNSRTQAETATVWKTLAENAGLEARGGTFREVAEAGLSGVRITLPADCGESKAMMGWFIV